MPVAVVAVAALLSVGSHVTENTDTQPDSKARCAQRIGPFLCHMYRIYVSAAFVAMCAASCTDPDDSCDIRWTADAAQLSASSRTESGELILSAQNMSESVAIRVISTDSLQIGTYSLTFRDLSTDLADGRCGIMVYSGTDAPIAGAVLQPELLLAFVKNTPTDAIDFRAVQGNAGSLELNVSSDSLFMSARVGDIVCSESCLRSKPGKLALFVGAASPTGQGNVSVRFSEVSFSGTGSWTDTFDCNSVE